MKIIRPITEGVALALIIASSVGGGIVLAALMTGQFILCTP